jgi:hypothetical protein
MNANQGNVTDAACGNGSHIRGRYVGIRVGQATDPSFEKYITLVDKLRQNPEASTVQSSVRSRRNVPPSKIVLHTAAEEKAL